MMDEQWKTIPDTDYAVSNLGRVASMKRNKWKMLSLGKDSGGYVGIGVQVNGRKKRHTIQRLVADSFLPPKPTAKHELNHIDGDKANNRVDNLEWMTHSENMRHSFAVLGRVGKNTNPRRGEDHGRAKLTADKVRDIRRRRAAGERVIDIAADLGVSPPSVSYAALGKTWREVV